MSNEKRLKRTEATSNLGGFKHPIWPQTALGQGPITALKAIKDLVGSELSSAIKFELFIYKVDFWIVQDKVIFSGRFRGGRSRSRFYTDPD